jgi:hypothetical protein
MRDRAWRKRGATRRSRTYQRWRRTDSSSSLSGNNMLLLVHQLSPACLCTEREEQGKTIVEERSREQQGLERAEEEQNLVTTEYRSRERTQN